MPFKPFLNWLSREGYGSLASIDKSQAENYLNELWNKAPKLVFLSQFVGLVFIQLSPVLYFFRLTFFHKLNPAQNEIMQTRLSSSRFYPVRLLFYGVRAHALVAQFRRGDKPLELRMAS